MPELPEVEVTRMGIAPHIEGRRIEAVTVRHAKLRWPVPTDLSQQLNGALVRTVARRGKFILLGLEAADASHRGTLLIHLGMTGTLRILPRHTLPKPHDHIDVQMEGSDKTGSILLRYNDPRRFGAWLWHDASDGAIAANPHLAGLGVEPLTPVFAERGAQLLYEQTRGRSAPIKQILLAGQIVVGVGNIYASESLFRAGINPKTAAGRIGLARYQRLAEAIRAVLAEAIQKGGSTLRDFVRSDGSSGYFQLDYFVYDRAGQPCRFCATPIKAIRQGQRSSFYCPHCQT